MPAPISDPRYPHLMVCLEHGKLYDPAPHPEWGEQQQCHGPEQERWPSCDFNEWVHLCDCCVQDTQLSGSRWSLFFCDTCHTLIREAALGVPIGRHSAMNRVSLPGRVAIADPGSIDRFAARVTGLFGSIDALHAWSRDRVRGLAGHLDTDPSLSYVVAAARRRWDKLGAVTDLARYWRWR